MAQKRMTIEDLAIITKKGFDELHGLMGRLESDVTELKHDVTELTSDVTELKHDVTELTSDVTELKNTGAYLKAHVSEISMWTSTHEDEHEKIELRLAKLEKSKAEV